MAHVGAPQCCATAASERHYVTKSRSSFLMSCYEPIGVSVVYVRALYGTLIGRAPQFASQAPLYDYIIRYYTF